MSLSLHPVPMLSNTPRPSPECEGKCEGKEGLVRLKYAERIDSVSLGSSSMVVALSRSSTVSDENHSIRSF